MDITKIIIDPKKTISMRYSHVANTQLFDVINDSYKCLVKHIEKNNANLPEAPYVAYLGRDKNGHLNNKDMDVEIVFPVIGNLPESESIKCGNVPLSEGVTLTYKGDYRLNSDELYDKMIDWIKENNYKSDGISYEYYLTNEKTPLNEQVTMIIMPVKREAK